MSIYNSKYSQLGAYLLIVLVGGLGFVQINLQADKIAKQTEERQTERVELTNQLCIQSKTTRDALREQITATAELAKSLVPAQNPELVSEVLRFQSVQLANLPHIKCETNGK